MLVLTMGTKKIDFLKREEERRDAHTDELDENLRAGLRAEAERRDRRDREAEAGIADRDNTDDPYSDLLSRHGKPRTGEDQ